MTGLCAGSSGVGFPVSSPFKAAGFPTEAFGNDGFIIRPSGEVCISADIVRRVQWQILQPAFVLII